MLRASRISEAEISVKDFPAETVISYLLSANGGVRYGRGGLPNPTTMLTY